LTGRREYEGAEIEAAVARLHRPPAVPDDLPFGLTRLLSLMTSLSAARRPTARECANALLAADAPTRVAPLPRRSRGVLAAVAAAVLVTAVGTGFVVQNRTTPAPPTSTRPTTVQQTSAPVVEQPVVETTVPPPVQETQKGKAGKGNSGKGKGKNKP
ncbi:MAG TPA: hypothetical protein VF821_27335, partial [Lentzea sp.]